MIETIIKRDGTKQPFDPRKLNGWGEWASNKLGNKVDWAEAVLHVATTIGKEATSRDLQIELINFCLTKPSWAYNRMAGRLYSALINKDLYGDSIPTVKECFTRLTEVGLMDEGFLNAWTDEEYAEIEKIIDHSKDLRYAQYQIAQSLKKYALKNRVEDIDYETPQFTYMRVAMRSALNKKNRLQRVRRNYEKFSDNKVNIPTPYFTNAGTKNNNFASCCVHHTKDTVKSLAAHNHISYMMTVASAGQGNKVYTRTINDPVRGGAIPHQGVTPYYRAEVAMINANLQNGRGGAETQSYDCYNPEVESIQAFKNPMTPAARQVRGLDYAMCFNTFFARLAARGEKVALFSFLKAPEIYEAMTQTSEEEFEVLYNKAVAEGRHERFVYAREILINALKEAVETGRHYVTNLTEMNRHTPFKEPIYLSNLCQEIGLVTKPFSCVTQLYKTDWDEDEEIPEVGMCSLGGIVVSRIESDEDYAECAYVALDLIHTGITESDYPLPQIEYTAKRRMSAGVGIVSLAHLMAKKKLKYSSQEGLDFIHEVAETHYWHLLNASLELSKEFGVAPWMHKTKWVDGWLPIDTYNRNVDSIVTVGNKRDWETLRQAIIENKGHAFSVLVAHMPAESSSIASGGTNGIYPVRELDMTKSNDTDVVTYVVPDSDTLAKHYENAYDTPLESMAKVYGVIQKWTDQGISADEWIKAQGEQKITTDELLERFFLFVKFGVKSRYYLNTLTAKGLGVDGEILPYIPEEEPDCEGCKL